jgi:hypothetical protein
MDSSIVYPRYKFYFCLLLYMAGITMVMDIYDYKMYLHLILARSMYLFKIIDISCQVNFI